MRKQNSLSLLAIFMIASICLLLTTFSACSGTDDNKENNKENTAHKQGKESHADDHGNQVFHLSKEVQQQIDIKTSVVKAEAVKSTLKAMGNVLAPNNRKAIVSFGFPARIVKLHAAIGQWVKAGQPLITIECEEVGSARSQFVKSLTDCQLAKLDFQREERLFKKDIGAKKDYLQAQATYQIAQAARTAAEKKLSIMGLSQEQIQELYKTKAVSPRITVTAPIEGRIIQNQAVLGAAVEPTTQIMIIVDLAQLWIDAEIYEKDLSRTANGQDVEISVPAYPGKIFRGKIHYIGDQVRTETRTITVRTLVMNPDFKLKPGMFADIRILTGSRADAVTVPKEAILDDGDKRIVFIREGDHFSLRTIKVGVGHNGLVEILEGLEIGETVVTEGNYQLKSMLHKGELHHGHSH